MGTHSVDECNSMYDRKRMLTLILERKIDMKCTIL